MKASGGGNLHPSATYLSGARGPECRVDETHASDGYSLPGHYHAGGAWVNPNGGPLARGRTAWYIYDGLCWVAAEVDPSGTLIFSGVH